MRNAMFGAGMGAMLLAGVALVVGAQGPPPPGRFGGGRGPGPGGPMAGVFEFGGLMGGFGGKVVTGKPILAKITIAHTEILPDNTITNTSTGTFARDADGSIFRGLKFAAIGPWATSGRAQEFAYIRNVTQGTQYVVNVTKGTYRDFPIRDRKPSHDRKKDRSNASNANNETVTDNPSGSYIDPATNTHYPVEYRKVTRTIPAGTIGNLNAIVITSERWYSTALDLLLEDTHTDPRFGTTTYRLSNIGQSPSASLFTPDPSFKHAQGGEYGGGGHRAEGKQPPPPPQD